MIVKEYSWLRGGPRVHPETRRWHPDIPEVHVGSGSGTGSGVLYTWDLMITVARNSCGIWVPSLVADYGRGSRCAISLDGDLSGVITLAQVRAREVVENEWWLIAQQVEDFR